MATLEQALVTLQSLADELRRRQPEITLYDAYYRGEHKLRFASDEFARRFSTRYRNFADNWTGVVADAPVERLQPIGIRLKGSADSDPGDSGLWDVWLEQEADALSDLAWLDAVIAKRSYALVWADDDGSPVITWEHPSQAIVSYDPETRKRAAGLKLWSDGANEYATLYLPDEVWKLQRPAYATSGYTNSGLYIPGADASGWQRRQSAGDASWPLPNPLGEVPLVEFANRPRLLGEPLSDIAGTVAMQDAVNLLWSYLFNAADFASFPQRIVTGMERPMIPILDEQGQEIGERPVDLEKFAVDRVVWLEDPNAKTTEWSAANLEAYTKIIEVQVGHIAAQTRTPQHYLVGKMANLSADALKAAETGLVKRTEEKTEHFGRGVREVFRLVCLVQGEVEKAKAVRAGTVLWKDVESRSEAQLVDALQKLSAIGFPFQYIAERYGLSPAEVERVVAMKEEEAANDPVLQAGRLLGTGASADGSAPSPQASPPAEAA